jgi:hypothetical protein
MRGLCLGVTKDGISVGIDEDSCVRAMSGQSHAEVVTIFASRPGSRKGTAVTTAMSVLCVVWAARNASVVATPCVTIRVTIADLRAESVQCRSYASGTPKASNRPLRLIAGLVTVNRIRPVAGARISASGWPSRSTISPKISPAATCWPGRTRHKKIP